MINGYLPPNSSIPDIGFMVVVSTLHAATIAAGRCTQCWMAACDFFTQSMDVQVYRAHYSRNGSEVGVAMMKSASLILGRTLAIGCLSLMLGLRQAARDTATPTGPFAVVKCDGQAVLDIHVLFYRADRDTNVPTLEGFADLQGRIYLRPVTDGDPQMLHESMSVKVAIISQETATGCWTQSMQIQKRVVYR